MSTLARQGALTGKPYSLARDNQLRSQIEAAFTLGLGLGVVSGGRCVKTTGFSAQIAAGTVFWAEGVSLTLASAQTYTAAVIDRSATAPIYIYAQILRTAASQSVAANLDTYTLDITYNTTGAAPSDAHFLIATHTTDGVGILTIDDAPQGKYLPMLRRVALVPKRLTVLTSGVSYRVTCDFSPGGKFEDPCFMLSVPSDEGGIIINPNLQEFTRGQFGLTLYVPPDASVGTYGGIRDLELSVTLVGRGWSGNATTLVPASWTAPVQVQ